MDRIWFRGTNGGISEVRASCEVNQSRSGCAVVSIVLHKVERRIKRTPIPSPLRLFFYKLVVEDWPMLLVVLRNG